MKKLLQKKKNSHLAHKIFLFYENWIFFLYFFKWKNIKGMQMNSLLFYLS